MDRGNSGCFTRTLTRRGGIDMSRLITVNSSDCFEKEDGIIEEE